jgi:hypothetical protein
VPPNSGACGYSRPFGRPQTWICGRRRARQAVAYSGPTAYRPSQERPDESGPPPVEARPVEPAHPFAPTPSCLSACALIVSGVTDWRQPSVVSPVRLRVEGYAEAERPRPRPAAHARSRTPARTTTGPKVTGRHEGAAQRRIGPPSSLKRHPIFVVAAGVDQSDGRPKTCAEQEHPDERHAFTRGRAGPSAPPCKRRVRLLEASNAPVPVIRRSASSGISVQVGRNTQMPTPVCKIDQIRLRVARLTPFRKHR